MFVIVCSYNNLFLKYGYTNNKRLTDVMVDSHIPFNVVELQMFKMSVEHYCLE